MDCIRLSAASLRAPGRGALRVAVALGLLGLANACSESQGDRRDGGPRVIDVQVVVATPGALPRTLSAVGSLQSTDMATMASEIAGTVVALDIPEGQLVTSGHVVARLDDGEARASLSVARARLKNAHDRLARLESLRAESVSSAQAYDDATSAFEAAQGAFAEAQERLDKTEISAPFDGVLGLRQASVGQFLRQGDPVVEITRIDPLELVFALPQRFISQVAVDQTVTGIVGRCGPRFEAKVRAVDPRIDPATRSVRLLALVPNPDGKLYPGMAARLRLLVDRIPAAIVVPQEAIVRQGTKHIVYTLDAENQAQQNEVRLGEFFADGVHVASGIEANARVVVAGQQKLRPGATANPQPHTPTRNPNLDLGRFGPLDDCDMRS